MQFFKHKFKRPLQIVQLVAIIIVTALVCVRLNERSTAFDVLAILMSLASLFLMAYQLITQNVGKYHHLGNAKVYFIINLSETVLWTVVMIVGVSTNIGRCTSGSEKGSTSCVVSLRSPQSPVPLGKLRAITKFFTGESGVLAVDERWDLLSPLDRREPRPNSTLRLFTNVNLELKVSYVYNGVFFIWADDRDIYYTTCNQNASAGLL